ncbi:hypothetical protein AXFE_03920 [Acidithrix ferrooxidans]|uniref:Uncharacterized protein n=1 Tax=Acidithrix ferrooxidans TaxID=1280514 RepID=A0A0D8HL13_9ACTN|nr:hypothetical protein AXFE_03920 [Acidithrix ferrooxidans]
MLRADLLYLVIMTLVIKYIKRFASTSLDMAERITKGSFSYLDMDERSNFNGYRIDPNNINT